MEVACGWRPRDFSHTARLRQFARLLYPYHLLFRAGSSDLEVIGVRFDKLVTNTFYVTKLESAVPEIDLPRDVPGGLAVRASRASVLTTFAQGTKFLINLGSIAILARLLSPEDFGIVTMVGVLTGFLKILQEGGLSMATIQKDSISHNQLSNLFWLNVSLGLIAALIGIASAPLLSRFFGEPRLGEVTVILACTFLISGASVQHVALLNREMKFGHLAIVDLGSALLGAGMAALLAMNGFAYWALVASQIVTTGSECLLAFWMTKWRPGLPCRELGTRSLFGFGASLTLSNVLRRIASSADVFLLGRAHGSVELGLYSRGLALVLRPLDQFMVPFDRVFLPLLSRLQADPQRYRRVFLDVFSVIALFSFPAAGAMMGLSEPLVLVLLGMKWQAVSPVFAAFSIAAIYYPLACAAMWLLTTQARTDDILQSGVVLLIIPIACVLTGLPWGSVGVALGLSVGGVTLRLPYLFHLAGRKGPVTWVDLWKVFFAHIPLLVLFLSLSQSAQRFVNQEDAILRLFLGFLGVVGAGLCACLIPFYRREALQLYALLMKALARRS